MDVNTIIIEQDDAMQKLAAYRGLNARQRTHEDDRLQQLYKAVSKGARVLNLAEAFRQTGLNDLGQPKLAIAQADWSQVVYHPWIGSDNGTFWWKTYWSAGSKGQITLPENTYSFRKQQGNEISSPVPHIPPALRPKIALSNFHILFEVEKWETYPVDPFLLRHISGHLYVVVAEWELTELEASLLGSMRTGN